MKKITIYILAISILFTAAELSARSKKNLTLKKVSLLDRDKNQETSNLNRKSTAAGKMMLDLNNIFKFIQYIGLLGDSDGFEIGLTSSPAIGFHYFVIDGLSMGARFTYNIQQSKITGYVLNTHQLGFFPQIAYYFDLFSNFHLFTGAGVLYGFYNQEISKTENIERNTLGFKYFLGTNYILFKDFGIFGELTYEFSKVLDQKDEETVAHNVLVTAGLKFFF